MGTITFVTMNNLTASTNAVKDYLYTYTDGHFPFMFTGPLLPSYFSLVKVIMHSEEEGELRELAVQP